VAGAEGLKAYLDPRERADTRPLEARVVDAEQELYAVVDERQRIVDTVCSRQPDHEICRCV
jgi:hypothetical protein